MRFNSFKQFTKLYEAESNPAATEGSFPPEADLLLKNIAQLGLSVLWYLNKMVPGYKDTIADIQSVVQSPDKLAKLVEIATKIKGNVKNQEYIQAGIPELFLQSAQENAKAFQKFTETYCQTEEGKSSMKEFVEDQILGYLKFLEEESKKIAQQTQTTAPPQKNESRFWFSLGSESLYEQDNEIKRKFLQGNKGLVKMLSKEATIIASDLELAKKANPAQESEIVALETKLTGILAELTKLSVAKRSEIAQNRLDELADELSSIPKSLTEIQKRSAEKIQKGSQNWDISSIYLKALNFYQQALEKFNQIKPSPSESGPAKTSGIKSQAEGIESIVKIKPDDVGVKGKVNPDVQKFQEFVITIFENSEIKDDPLFLKFKNYGPDGKFGPTTKNMVISLKSAFDMDDETPNISKELIRELIDYAKEKKLMESEIFSEPKVVDFMTFSASLFEGFDPEKFKDSSRKLRGSGSGTGGSSQSGSGGSSTGGGSQSGSGGSGTAPGGGTSKSEADEIMNNENPEVKGRILEIQKILKDWGSRIYDENDRSSTRDKRIAKFGTWIFYAPRNEKSDEFFFWREGPRKLMTINVQGFLNDLKKTKFKDESGQDISFDGKGKFGKNSGFGSDFDEWNTPIPGYLRPYDKMLYLLFEDGFQDLSEIGKIFFSNMFGEEKLTDREVALLAIYRKIKTGKSLLDLIKEDQKGPIIEKFLTKYQKVLDNPGNFLDKDNVSNTIREGLKK